MAKLVNFTVAAGVAALVACNPSQQTPSSGASAPATTAQKKETADPMIVAADKGRIAGDPNAKTWLIEASDFQCPFCKQWHDETYKAVYDEYVKTGKVRLAYVNYPLGQHQNAMPSAEAAMCAAAQGKFWEYHDALFTTQKQWETLPMPTMVFDSLAGAVGLDKAEWKMCLDSGRMKSLISADRDRAERAGVQSTPTFMIGDRLIVGAEPIAGMRAVLDSEIAKNGGASH